ncbi:MAG: LamG domain-containing protein [Acetobacteraceae bacterium]
MITRTRRGLTGTIGLAVLTGISVRQPAAARPVPYHARVLAKRPVAYWRFEERDGPLARDSTKHGHDGSYQGEVAFRQGGAIRSEPDFAIGLNGKNAFVLVPDSTAFSQPASGRGLTVEAWFRPDVLKFQGQTTDPYVHWLGKGETGAYEWGFRFYSKSSPDRPNRVSAYIWNPASLPGERNEGTGAYFQDELRAAEWVHVVACYDPGDADTPGAGVSIYKDGVLRGSPATSPGALYSTYDIHPQHGTAPVRLGTRDAESFLRGGLDEIAIYPRVLSAEEILDNFRAASRAVL